MAERVTIQDIADALGISRNTVSKAINNTGVLAEATRQKVLAKAIELGYKQFSYVDIDSIENGGKTTEKRTGEIALISQWFLNASHFSSMMLDKFQLEISKIGYSLSMHVVRPEEILENKLPETIHLDRCKGIMCIEMFVPEYAEFLTSLDIPVLFVDAPVSSDGIISLNADKLLMNNTDCILDSIKIMKQRGIRKIGYVGEAFHCQSFFERYSAFLTGMSLQGLAVNNDWLLTKTFSNIQYPQNKTFSEYVDSRIRELKELPEVFICANDFVAMDLMNSVKSIGLSIPNDIMILGFDDSQESRIISPSISTIHIHSQIMGFSAMQLLVSRIEEPQLNYRTLYCETSLMLRETTRDSGITK